MSDDPFGAALDARSQSGTDDDAFGSALAAHASSDTPAKSAHDKAIDLMNQPANPVAELIQQGASNAAHTIWGGYKGAYTALTTGDMNQAAQDVRDEQAKAYEPSDRAKQLLKKGQDAARVVVPFGTLAGQSQQLADWGADKSADWGASPAVSAAIKSVPAAIPLLDEAAGMGGRALTSMRGEDGVLSPLPKPAAPLTAQQALEASSAGDKQSMGAAAAVPDISDASPTLQQSIVAAQKKGQINRDVLMRHKEAEANGVQLSEGQATRDPALYSDERNDRANPNTANLYLDRFNKQPGQLRDRLDEIRQNASPTLVQNNQLGHGQALIDKYKTMDEAARADISAKYKALEDANGGSFPLDGETLVGNIDKALKQKFKTGSVPADIQSSLNEIRGGRQMNFEDFEQLRSDTADAARTATDGRARQAANIVREQLESLPLAPEAQGLKAIADQARQAAAARYARIEADPAYEAVVGDKTKVGTPSPLADTFTQKYLTGNAAKRANILKMHEHLGGDPEVGEIVQGATLNELRKKAGIDEDGNGSFKQFGYNNALRGIQDKADALLSPEVYEHAKSLGRTARDVQEAPPADFTNRSNTAVTSARQAAKDTASHLAATGAEHLLNAKTGIGGTIGRNMLQARSQKALAAAELQKAQAALAPGAGLNYQPR